MIVPFGNYDSPLKTFITKLDEQMNTILEKKIPVDEKIKLYNNVLYWTAKWSFFEHL